MRRKRRTFTPEFKLKVILESLKERLTLNEISQKYELYPNQISKWKTDFIENARVNLQSKTELKAKAGDADSDKLYQKIGQLQMEIDFLKKSLLADRNVRYSFLDINSSLSLRRQTKLLSVSRSKYYYKMKCETFRNIYIMELIGRQYQRTPFYGVPRRTDYLNDLGHQPINPKRIERLYKLMDIRAVGTNPNTSKSRGNMIAIKKSPLKPTVVNHIKD